MIPTKVARMVAESCGLQQWTTTLFPLPVAAPKSTSASLPIVRQKSVGEESKTELLKILLEVYMADE